MTIRFTLIAARQIEAAPDEIAFQSPKGASHVRQRLLAMLTMLELYPDAGRPTTKTGVRRIVVNPFPCLVDYSSIDDDIVVRRFRHAARRPVT